MNNLERLAEITCYPKDRLPVEGEFDFAEKVNDFVNHLVRHVNKYQYTEDGYKLLGFTEPGAKFNTEG